MQETSCGQLISGVLDRSVAAIIRFLDRVVTTTPGKFGYRISGTCAFRGFQPMEFFCVEQKKAVGFMDEGPLYVS